MLETIGHKIKLPTLKQYGISQKFSREFALILFANIVNNGTNFIANIGIARFYGQDLFGVYSIAVNIALTVLAFSEFGLNLTMVRYYKLYRANHIKSQAVLLWNLYFKLGILMLIGIIAIILGDKLSLWFMHGRDMAFIAAASVLTGGVLGLWSYIKAFLQALDLFKNMAYLILFFAFLRMSFLALCLFTTSKTTVETLFTGIYIVPVIIVVLYGFYLHKRKVRFADVTMDELKGIGKEILHFSKWVAVSSMASILISRSLIFIVAYYTDNIQVSLLSVAFIFTGILNLVTDSVRQLLFPKISGLKFADIDAYKKKVKKLLPVYYLLASCLIVLLGLLMRFALGERYAQSLILYIIASIGIAISAGIGFYSILLFAVMKPQLDMSANIGTLLILLVSSLTIVKAYGVMPAVLSFSVILVIGELCKAALLSKYLTEMKGNAV